MSDFRKKPEPRNDNQDISRWLASGSPQDFRAVRLRMEPVIDNGIKSYAGGDHDYRVKAYGLMQDALRTWNPQSGASPETHVYTRLRELQRVRGDREYVLHVPERTRILQGGVSRFSEEFESENGRPPTMDEVSRGMGVQRSKLKKLPTSLSIVPESAIGGEDDAGEAYGGSPEMPEDKTETWKEYIYDELGQDEDHRGQFIMEHGLGFGGKPPMSQTQIAQKLKISSAAVSKRMAGLRGRIAENPLLKG